NCGTSARPYFSNTGWAWSGVPRWTNANCVPLAASSWRFFARSASASRQNVQPRCRKNTTSTGALSDSSASVTPPCERYDRMASASETTGAVESIASLLVVERLNAAALLDDANAAVVLLEAAGLAEVFLLHDRDEVAADILAALDAQPRFRQRLDPLGRNLAAAADAQTRLTRHSLLLSKTESPMSMQPTTRKLKARLSARTGVPFFSRAYWLASTELYSWASAAVSFQSFAAPHFLLG